MRRLLALCSLLLIALPLLAASNWPMMGGDVRHTGSVTLRVPNSTPTAKWVATPAIGSPIATTPAMSPDNATAIVGTDDGRLIWVDMGTGSYNPATMVMRAAGRTPFRGTPLVLDDGGNVYRVYAVNQDGRLYAFRVNAGVISELWHAPSGNAAPFGGLVASPMRVTIAAEDYIIVASLDGSLYRVHAQTGAAARWFTAGGSLESTPAIGTAKPAVLNAVATITETNEISVGAGIAAQLAQGDGITFVPGAGVPVSRYIATVVVDADNVPTGRVKLDGPLTNLTVGTAGQVSTTPHLPLYFGCNDGHVYAVNADELTTHLRWSHPSAGTRTHGFLASPLLDGNHLFIGDRGGIFYVLETFRGTLLNDTTIPAAPNVKGAYTTGALLRDGATALVFLGFDGGVVSIDVANPAIPAFQITNYPVPAGVSAQPVIGVNENNATQAQILVGTEDGVVYCLDSNAAAPRWHWPDPARGMAIRASTIIAADRTILVPTRDGQLICLDNTGGPVATVPNVGPVPNGAWPQHQRTQAHPGARKGGKETSSAPTSLSASNSNYYNGMRLRYGVNTGGSVRSSVAVTRNSDTIRETRLAVAIPAPPTGVRGEKVIAVGDTSNLHIGDILMIGTDYLGPITAIDRTRKLVATTYGPAEAHAKNEAVVVSLYRMDTLKAGETIHYGSPVSAVAKDADAGELWYAKWRVFDPAEVDRGIITFRAVLKPYFTDDLGAQRTAFDGAGHQEIRFGVQEDDPTAVKNPANLNSPVYVYVYLNDRGQLGIRRNAIAATGDVDPNAPAPKNLAARPDILTSGVEVTLCLRPDPANPTRMLAELRYRLPDAQGKFPADFTGFDPALLTYTLPTNQQVFDTAVPPNLLYADTALPSYVYPFFRAQTLGGIKPSFYGQADDITAYVSYNPVTDTHVAGPGTRSIQVNYPERFLVYDLVQITSPDNQYTEMVRIGSISGDRLYLDGGSGFTNVYPAGSRLWVGQPGQWAAYAGSDEGSLRAIDPDTGNRFWRNAALANMGAVAGVAIDEELARVYATTVTGRLYAFAQNGQFLWAYPSADLAALGPISGAPVIDDNGNIYFTCQAGRMFDNAGVLAFEGGRVFKVDADGQFVAVYPPNSGDAFAPIMGGLALYAVNNNLRVVFAGSDGKLTSLDANLQKVWEYALPGGAGVTATPVIDANGTIYIGDEAGKVHAVYENAGAAVSRWQNAGTPVTFDATGPIRVTGAVANGVLYLGDATGKVYAINTTDHTAKVVQVEGGVTGPLTIDDSGNVLVSTEKGNVYCFAPITADDQLSLWKWNARLDGQAPSALAFRTAPALWMGVVVIVGNDDGTVYGIGPKSTKWGNAEMPDRNIQLSAGLWPFFHRDVQRAGNAGELATPVPGPAQPTLRWWREMQKRPGSSPVVTNHTPDRIARTYEGTEDGRLFAANASTGDPITAGAWDDSEGFILLPGEGPIRATPAVRVETDPAKQDRNGALAVGGMDGRLYLVKPDGTLAWNTLNANGKLYGNFQASPVVAKDGTVYAATADTLDTAGDYIAPGVSAANAKQWLTDGDANAETSVTGNAGLVIDYDLKHLASVTRIRIRTANAGELYLFRDGQWALYGVYSEVAAPRYLHVDMDRYASAVRWRNLSDANVEVFAFEVYTKDSATALTPAYTPAAGGWTNITAVEADLGKPIYLQRVIITTRDAGTVSIIDANDARVKIVDLAATATVTAVDIPINQFAKKVLWESAAQSSITRFDLFTYGGGRVYAFAADTGVEKWQYPDPAVQPQGIAPIVSGLVAAEGDTPGDPDTVFACTLGGQVIAIHGDDRSPVWAATKEIPGRFVASPVLVERAATAGYDLLVADESGGLHLLKGESGDYVNNFWPRRVPGPVTNSFLVTLAAPGTAPSPLTTVGPLAPPSTERVNLTTPGNNQGNGDSGDYYTNLGITGDGRYVVFDTDATNLVADDTDTVRDIYLRDRTNNVTTLVSTDQNNVKGNGDSRTPVISADGKYVAFRSLATNLVNNDTNATWDIFLKNLTDGSLVRVSEARAGGAANNQSTGIAIDEDGSIVAFASRASDLVLNDTNNRWDIFVYDRVAGALERVSVKTGGLQANGDSYAPAVSADGRYVAFYSYASNLIDGDTNNLADVFVHDRQTGITTRVSVANDGTQGNGSSHSPVISADGQIIAFASSANNLVQADTNGQQDVFVRDLQANTTLRASIATDGTQANDSSIVPAISADGRFVGFASNATNLVNNDANGMMDVFLRDTSLNETVRISVATDGTPGNGMSFSPALSSDGNDIAFYSDAGNLVANDTNGKRDVFLYNQGGVAPPLGIYGRKAYLITDRGQVYRFDNLTAGTFTLLRELPTAVKSSPVMDSTGRIYVGSDSGALYCLAPETGNVLWKYQPDRSGLTSSLYQSVAAGTYNLPVSSVFGFRVGDPVQITRPDGSQPEDLGQITGLTEPVVANTRLQGVSGRATNADGSDTLIFAPGTLPANVAVGAYGYLITDPGTRYRVVAIGPNTITINGTLTENLVAVDWVFSTDIAAGQRTLAVASVADMKVGDEVSIMPWYDPQWDPVQTLRPLGKVEVLDTVNNIITLDREIPLFDLNNDGAIDVYSVDSQVIVGPVYGYLQVSVAPTRFREAGDIIRVVRGLSWPIRTSPSIGPSQTVYIGVDDGILYAVGPIGPSGYPDELPALPLKESVSSWWTFHQNNQRLGYAERPGAYTRDLRWYQDTGSTLESSPALGYADSTAWMGILYVGISDDVDEQGYRQLRGGLLAYDGSSGRLRWRFDDDNQMGRVFSSPAVFVNERQDASGVTLKDEMVVVGTVDMPQSIIADLIGAILLDDNGNEVAAVGQIPAGAKVVGLYVNNGGLFQPGADLYLTDPDTGINMETFGIVDAYNANTGFIRLETVWTAQRAHAFGSDVHAQTSQQGHLYCVDRAGELRWKFPPAGAAASERIGAVHSSPVVDPDGVTYFGTQDGVIYAVDMDGNEKWMYVVPRKDMSEAVLEVSSSPALDSAGTRLFVGVSLPEKNTGYLVALDISTVDDDKRQLWMIPLDGPVTASPMLMTIDGVEVIYLGVDDLDNTDGITGKFYCIDAKDGTILYQRDRWQLGSLDVPLGPIYSTAAGIPESNTLVNTVLGLTNDAGNTQTTIRVASTEGLLPGMRVKVRQGGSIVDGSILSIDSAQDFTITPALDLGVFQIARGGISVRTNEQLVLVGTLDGYLLAFTEKLQPLWRFASRVTAPVRTSPAISTETGIYGSKVRSYSVYFGANDRYLYALRFYGNKQFFNWERDLRARQYASPIVGLRTADNGRAVVYQASRDHFIYCFGDEVNYDGDVQDPEPPPTNGTDPEDDPNVKEPAALEVSKYVEYKDDDPTWWKFIITVRNTGRGDATDVKIYDTMPETLCDVTQPVAIDVQPNEKATITNLGTPLKPQWQLVWTKLDGTGLTFKPNRQDPAQDKLEHTRTFAFYARVKESDRTYDQMGTKMKMSNSFSIMVDGRTEVTNKEVVRATIGDTIFLQLYKHPIPLEQGGSVGMNQVLVQGKTQQGSGANIVTRNLETRKETPVQNDWTDTFVVRMYYNGRQGADGLLSQNGSKVNIFSPWNYRSPETGEPLILTIPVQLKATGRVQAWGRRMVSFPSANKLDGWAISGVQLPLYPTVSRFDRSRLAGMAIDPQNPSVIPYAWRVTIQQGRTQLNQKIAQWGPELPFTERIKVALVQGGGGTSLTVDDGTRVKKFHHVIIFDPATKQAVGDAFVTDVVGNTVTLSRAVGAAAGHLVLDEWSPDVIITNPVNVSTDTGSPNTLTLGGMTAPGHTATSGTITLRNAANWGVTPTFPQYRVRMSLTDLRHPSAGAIDWNSLLTGDYTFGETPKAGADWDGFQYDPYRENYLAMNQDATDLPEGIGLRANQAVTVHVTRTIPAHQPAAEDGAGGYNTTAQAERKPTLLAAGNVLYQDLNGNNAYDKGTDFRLDDMNGNGLWDAWEVLYCDQNGNDIYDQADSFTDQGTPPNGVYDQNEPFVDKNGNGRYDTAMEPAVTFNAYDTRIFMDMNGNRVWDAGEPYYVVNPAAGDPDLAALDMAQLYRTLAAKISVSSASGVQVPNTVIDLGKMMQGSPFMLPAESPRVNNTGNTTFSGLTVRPSTSLSTTAGGNLNVSVLMDELERTGLSALRFLANDVILRQDAERQPLKTSAFNWTLPATWTVLKPPAGDTRDFGRPFAIGVNINDRQPSGTYTNDATVQAGGNADGLKINLRVTENRFSQVVAWPGSTTPTVPSFDDSQQQTPEMRYWTAYLTGAESWPTAMVLPKMRTDVNTDEIYDPLGVWVASNTPLQPAADPRPMAGTDLNKLLPTPLTDTNIWFRRTKHLVLAPADDTAGGMTTITLAYADWAQVRAATNNTADLVVLRRKHTVTEQPFQPGYYGRVIAKFQDTADGNKYKITVYPALVGPAGTAVTTDIWSKDTTAVEIYAHPWVPLLNLTELEAIRAQLADPGQAGDTGPHPIRCTMPSVSVDAAGDTWLAWTIAAVRHVTINGQTNNVPVSFLAYKKFDPKNPSANSAYWIGDPNARPQPGQPAPLTTREKPVFLTTVKDLTWLVLYEAGPESQHSLYFGYPTAINGTQASWQLDLPLNPINWAFANVGRAQVWADSTGTNKADPLSGEPETPISVLNLVVQAKRGDNNTDLYYARLKVDKSKAIPLVLLPIVLPEAADADNGIVVEALKFNGPKTIFTGGQFLAWGNGLAPNTPLEVLVNAPEPLLDTYAAPDWQKLNVDDSQREYILESPDAKIRLSVDPYRGIVRVLKGAGLVNTVTLRGVPRLQRLTTHLSQDLNPLVSLERWRYWYLKSGVPTKEFGPDATNNLLTAPRVWTYWVRQHEDGLGSRVYYRTFRMNLTQPNGYTGSKLARLDGETRDVTADLSVDMPERMLPMEVFTPDGSIYITKQSAGINSPEAGLWVLSTASRDVWPPYPYDPANPTAVVQPPTQHDLFLQVLNVPVPEK